MKLSVIIPCYNAEDTIAIQLEALASQRWSEPWEIIVADNRSTDESMSIVEQYKRRLPNLRIVDASARRGQPFALNVGAQDAAGDALAFCDADDEVGVGWLVAMGDALSYQDFVACRFDIEKLNPPSMRNTRRNPQPNGIQAYVYPPYLPHAGGGSLGVKRHLHEAIGGFDESLPILHDTDYCWRLQLAGTELHFVQDAVTHIRYRDSLSGTYRQARGYGEYNVLLYKRYRPMGMPRLPWHSGLKLWMKLFRRLPQFRFEKKRGGMMWELGWRLGRLRGCIKYRTFAL